MTDSTSEDRIWRALAEPTRRRLLDALSDEARTTGDLVEQFPDLCRTAVMKHLDVLVGAGLVVVRREGRTRWNQLNPMPIQLIYDRWVSHHVRDTAAALARLKRHVEDDPPEPSEKASRKGDRR